MAVLADLSSGRRSIGPREFQSPVFMSTYCIFDLSVYYLFLQYFDTVGWVFWPVQTVSHITYTVLAAQCNPISILVFMMSDSCSHFDILRNNTIFKMTFVSSGTLNLACPTFSVPQCCSCGQTEKFVGWNMFWMFLKWLISRELEVCSCSTSQCHQSCCWETSFSILQFHFQKSCSVLSEKPRWRCWFLNNDQNGHFCGKLCSFVHCNEKIILKRAVLVQLLEYTGRKTSVSAK